ncbi:Protein kinase superfamily protein [Zea mays]|uniref:Protein kinase superfamily protein n=1 Tax=Zea mays TaxID=4577 RepID=A0A1D6HF10_MAIZE|nr:Protein kinase superfamily protein [Zea mays]
MEMAGAAEADTPSHEPVRTGRSNTILLPGAGQDAGRHVRERRLQPGSGPARAARAEGARGRRRPAEPAGHPPPGLLQEPGPGEEDLGRVQLRPCQALQEVGEGEEPERLLRAGHGLLQPVAVPETQHEAGTQEARGDREINGREC